MKKKLNCILLVDDNEYDNFLNKRLIKQADIAEHIEVAENGLEALDFLIGKVKNGLPGNAYCQPELIILDINMPVMDGWQFLEEFNKHEDLKKVITVIIMLTTSVNPADVAKTEKIFGKAHYHYKPLTLEMINEIITEHFPENL